MTNLYCYLGSILNATVILTIGGELKCNRRHWKLLGVQWACWPKRFPLVNSTLWQRY